MSLANNDNDRIQRGKYQLNILTRDLFFAVYCEVQRVQMCRMFESILGLFNTYNSPFLTMCGSYAVNVASIVGQTR